MSLQFGQIQPLVSMVTDRVMMGKMLSPLFLGCFSSDPFHTCLRLEISDLCSTGIVLYV